MPKVMTAEKKTVEVVIVKRRFMYLIVTSLITAMLSPWATIVYVNYVDRENRSGWCELITFYTDYYDQNPPQTPLQKHQAELMQQREQSLQCK